ncbi:MAG TPA: dihydropteroate synthase [Geminicoccaceae bacterium]|nr:dihydropteroate synthase [Geminicoccaceae bacterium]
MPHDEGRASACVLPTGIIRGQAARTLTANGLALPLGARRAYLAVDIALRQEGPAQRLAMRVDEIDAWLAGQPSRVRVDVMNAIHALGQEPEPLWAGAPAWPLLMGVVNVTPDSFSDGGRFLARDAAIEQGLRLAAAGAALVDVGGESTRPGAEPVPIEEEIRRVVPVIGALAAAGLRVSIDSRNAATMQAALAAGAVVINDVSALTHDPAALEVARASGVPVVLMHAQGDPRTMQQNPTYDDVVLDVFDVLAERVRACERAGIPRRRLVIDPGIGFGKTLEHNLRILGHLALFRGLGCALLLGVSRKSFIARLAQPVEAPPEARLPGSLAAALAGLARGADVLRVHDVLEMRQAMAVWRAIEEGESDL